MLLWVGGWVVVCKEEGSLLPTYEITCNGIAKDIIENRYHYDPPYVLSSSTRIQNVSKVIVLQD
jgi:hypothetical protein